MSDAILGSRTGLDDDTASAVTTTGNGRTCGRLTDRLWFADGARAGADETPAAEQEAPDTARPRRDLPRRELSARERLARLQAFSAA